MPKTPDPIDVAVGENVRRLRQARGLSQTALAAALGISFQQLQKYEKATNRIGSSRLRHIADALQVPLADLFSGPRLPSPDVDDVTAFLRSTEGIELNRAFKAIGSAPRRKAVLTFIKSLAVLHEASDLEGDDGGPEQS